MTLREYLESWDSEYLGEGITDKIKEKIKEKINKLKAGYEAIKFKAKNKWDGFLQDIQFYIKLLALIASAFSIIGLGNSVSDKIEYDTVLRDLNTNKAYIINVADNIYKNNLSPELVQKYEKQLEALNSNLHNAAQQLEKISISSEVFNEKKIRKTLKDAKICSDITLKTIKEIQEQAYREAAEKKEAEDKKIKEEEIKNIENIKKEIEENRNKLKKGKEKEMANPTPEDFF